MNKIDVRPYLDDLEARIDPAQEERLLQEWAAFAQGRFTGSVFLPRRECRPPTLEWPKVRVNAALDDFEQMVLQQFGQCSQMLADGSGNVLNVRCNYGSSILPSLFGVEMFIMDDALDTLPTSRPLNDVEAIHRLLTAGVPEPTAGWGARTLETGQRFLNLMRDYPKISRYVFIYHPDTQGPMDICEVLWGSTLFYALYDQPELVHDLLALITETYIRFMRAWTEIVPFRPEGSSHWGYYHLGSLMIRDDSAMNLSRAMFDEFVRPYDQRLLDEFGGGAIHFCGKGDHYIPSLGQMRNLYAINLSQPHLNNMEKVFANTIDRGICILGLERPAAEQALADGRDLSGRVHCS